MADFSAKQTALSVSIRKILCRDQLYSLFDCIDIHDIHDFLTEYVHREKSVEKISKMYHSTISLPTQIGMDCIEHMMSFLDIKDLASVSCVNAEFNELCSEPKQKNLENICKCDTRPMVEILNNPLPRNESLPYFLQPFPHEDSFHIDMRTVIKGDGKTYPERCSEVVYQYTGQWERHKGCTEWHEIAPPEIPVIFTSTMGQNELTIGFEQALMAMCLNEKARIWVPTRLQAGHCADFACEVTMIAVEYSDDGDEDDPRSGHWQPLDVRVNPIFLKESGTSLRSLCIDNEELDNTTMENTLDTNVEDALRFDVDAMYVVDCRRDKYLRKIKSRRKQEKRQRLKREYRNWDGKSKEKRIWRKMRKYRTIEF